MATAVALYYFHKRTTPLSYCSSISDKNLDSAISSIEQGMKSLKAKYPSIQRPNLNSGMRGTRYFIEFPMTSRNLDAFSILTSVQQLLTTVGKQDYGARVTATDSYVQDENVSYMIDYEVNSDRTPGSKTKGSVYIRGIKS